MSFKIESRLTQPLWNVVGEYLQSKERRNLIAQLTQEKASYGSLMRALNDLDLQVLWHTFVTKFPTDYRNIVHTCPPWWDPIDARNCHCVSPAESYYSALSKAGFDVSLFKPQESPLSVTAEKIRELLNNKMVKEVLLNKIKGLWVTDVTERYGVSHFPEELASFTPTELMMTHEMGKEQIPMRLRNVNFLFQKGNALYSTS